MKALLIDDEAASRTAIKMLADWKSNEITQVFEAENGLEGMGVILSEHPEIVFLDMNMPLVDGATFLEMIRSDYPDIAVIIASGYDRFDYAVKAIEAGAVSYLLKPIDPNQLNDALRKAAASVRKKDARLKTEKQTNRDALRALLERVFLQSPKRSKREENLLDELLPAGRAYAVCAMRLGNMSRAMAKHGGNIRLLCAALSARVEMECQDFGSGYFWVSEESPHRAMLLLIRDGESFQDAAVRDVLGRIRAELRDKFHLSALIGISGLNRGGAGIDEAVKRAGELLMQMNLFKAPECAVAFAPTSGSTSRFSALDLMPLYRSAVSTKNKAAFINILNIAFKPLREKGVFTLLQADQSIEHQINMMTDLLLKEGIPDSALFSAAEEPSKRFAFDYTTFEGFYMEMRRLLEVTVKALSDKLHWERIIDIQQVKTYINENCHKDLHVRNIAEIFFVSREYLTKLFSKQVGVCMHDYIDSVRMEKVRQLLDQPGMRVQDVAQIMSFWDANYLSKKFRKIYGLSPSQYQRNQSGDNIEY